MKCTCISEYYPLVQGAQCSSSTSWRGFNKSIPEAVSHNITAPFHWDIFDLVA